MSTDRVRTLILETITEELDEIFSFLKRQPTEEIPVQDAVPSPQPTKSFSFLTLKSLKTSKEIREYVRSSLKKLGTGQGRAAYEIDNDKILKLALSDSKAYQNKNEVDNAKCLGPSYSVKVYSNDPRYIWIIEERVTPFKTKEEFVNKFNELTNIQDPELKFKSSVDLRDFLADIFSFESGGSSTRYQNRHNFLMKNNEWYKGFVEKLKGCQVASWDFHSNNWGIRPSTGEMVLLDVGFNINPHLE